MCHFADDFREMIQKTVRIGLLVCLLLGLSHVPPIQAAVSIDATTFNCWSGMATPTLYASANVSAAGAYVLVGVTAYPGTTVSITDTQGSSYTLVNTVAANYAQTYVYLAPLAGNMTAWTDHIRVSTGGNMADACALVLGGLETNPLDGNATGSNNWSTAMSTANVMPSTANTLLVGVFGWQSNDRDATPGANWTEQQQSGVLLMETRQVSAAGSYAASATLSSADRWAAIVVALKVSAPHAPTDITLSNNTLAAADPPNTLVGTLAAVDVDTGETHTFSLVSGTGDTDNGSFTIAGNALRNSASLTPGDYSIRVNVNDGTYDFAKVFTITVSPYPSITGGDTSEGDYMTNVTFAGINHDSGDDGGYADYTADTATVTAGNGYPLTVTVNVGSATYPAIVVAWIDWNHNYSFDDAGERYIVGTGLGVGGANTAITTVNVPATAAIGATRMRVVMDANDGTTIPPNAGSTTFYGDAEDYTIQVNAAPCVSTGSGAWNSGATWSCGHVPDGSEAVTIAAGHTVALGGNVTQNGALTLNGDVNTASYVLTLGSGATVTGAGDVVGTVRRVSPAAGSALPFNNQYTTLTFATAPTQMDVTLVKTQPSGFSYAVDRLYTLTATGSAAATLRLHYKDTELHLANGATESSLNLFRYNGSAWVLVGRSAGDTTANWVEYNNVTEFSNWAISGNTPTSVAFQHLLSGRSSASPALGGIAFLLSIAALLTVNRGRRHGRKA